MKRIYQSVDGSITPATVLTPKRKEKIAHRLNNIQRRYRKDSYGAWLETIKAKKDEILKIFHTAPQSKQNNFYKITSNSSFGIERTK